MGDDGSMKSHQDVFATVLELSVYLRKQPGTRDRDLDRRGEELLAIFQDPNFKDSHQNLRHLKLDIIGQVCRDIAEGLVILRRSNLGVCVQDGKLVKFENSHREQSRPDIVFSISWKNHKSFLNWKNADLQDIPQEDLNASLYHLAVVLSQIALKAG